LHAFYSVITASSFKVFSHVWKLVGLKYNRNTQFLEEDEMDGACSTNGEKRNAYRLLVGKPEGKWPLGRWIIFGWLL
jgi:hypothetical protein